MKKRLRKFLPYIGASMTILFLFIAMILITNKVGRGSVPFAPGTEDFSVDVCINQDCDYVTDGQNDEREIKQAIDAVLAVGGGRVNIRNGDYSIASPVNVSLSGESLIIQGDGLDTKLTNAMTDPSNLGSMFVVDGQAASLLDTPADSSTSTSTAGSLVADTYYFRLTTFDDTGAKSQASSEISCTVGNEPSSGTSSLCKISWTDATGDEDTKVWVSTVSGSYSEYFLATTTGTYYYATSTNGLIIPTVASHSTTTGGSLPSGTYHFRITALDANGNQTVPTSEVGCYVIGTPTTTACKITWEDSVNATSHRVWVSSFSGNYTGYFAATTSNTYFLATTTSLVTGTISTSNTTSLDTDSVSDTIETISLDGFTMKDLYLVGNSTGGKGLITANINKVEIISSRFTDFTTSATWGVPIYASSSGQTIIEKCIFKDNTEDIELAGKTSNTYILNNIFNDDGEITIGSGATNIIITNNSNLTTITDNGGSNLRISNDVNIGIGTPAPQEALVLGNDNVFSIELDVPDDFLATLTSTSTVGTADEDTYYFRITALDLMDGQTIPSDETSCTTVEDGDASIATSTICEISWTDIIGESDYRIWVATTSDVYYGYFTATTTNQYTFSTSSSLTVGTIPTVSNAYVAKIATSTPSWLMTESRITVGRLTQGNGILASTSMNTTVTLVENDLLNYSGWDFTPNAANTVATLPASSTLTTFIPNAGQWHTIYLSNKSLVSATTTTVVGGTGTTLYEPTGADVVINGTGKAPLTFFRESNTNISVYVGEYQPG